MVANLFSKELGELHRHEMIAAAPSAHLRRLAARDRRRARREALAAWLPRLRRRRVAPTTVRPATPPAVNGGLSVP
ncbi:MAG TPA: hypothetical protein VKD67_08070 [Acidimicrobiales bacterium]|nr:hypothetical protein [Acidimicrobiales bacterium]